MQSSGKQSLDEQYHIKRIDPQAKSSIIPSNGNFMSSNRNVVISALIILVTVVLGGYLLITKKDSLIRKGSSTDIINTVGLKFSEKSFKLDYANIDPETVLEISDFERKEEWRGSHEYDDVIFWKGEYSLLLSSKDNEQVDAYTEKSLNLDKHDVFKMALNVQTDPADIESVKVYFSDKDKNSSYYYSIRSIVKGWNFLVIPKEKFSTRGLSKEPAAASPGAITGELSWSNIERVGFELASRANSSSEINVDSMETFINEEYLDSWLVKSPVQLNLAKVGGQYYLEGRNYGGSVALLKKLSGISNFKFKAKLMPMKSNARSGLFVRGDYKTGYGYYFVIDGINGNRYQIFKVGLDDEKVKTTVLKNGVINNFIVEKDVPLWLSVEAKGSNFKYSLSMDDKSYSELAQVNDSEYKEGGLGIAVLDLGATLFDMFDFSQ